MKETCLNNQQQQILRSNSKITYSEVAYKIGDLFIAINVTDNTRRILETKSVENLLRVHALKEVQINKQLLKG